MAFAITAKVEVTKDERGVVRRLFHPRQPFGSEAMAAATGAPAVDISPRALADEYLQEVLPALDLRPDMADDLDAAVSSEPVAGVGQKLRFATEAVQAGQATVSYDQTTLGLPVWQAGVAVRLRGRPFEVTGSQSSVHHDLDVTAPPPDAPYLPERIDADVLIQLLTLPADASRPTITGAELLVYRYCPHDRGNGAAGPDQDDVPNAHEALPTLTLPPLPSSLVAGRHYVVANILFTMAHAGWEPMNWSAFVEPQTGAVLHLRLFTSCVDGLVLERDPLTASGDLTTMPTSPLASLNALRTRVNLDSLDSPAPPGPSARQQLQGRFVRLVSVSPPAPPIPSQPPGIAFDFAFDSDDFAAVNAYHHCDSCFRTLEAMGFDIAAYFDGTQFPVRVDHRATIGNSANAVNAQAPGNGTGTGSDGFRFALLDAGATIGMAVEARVTWHEFGHALLWDTLHSPNFPFAHSIGDTLAAILYAPELQAPDAGRTYPWTVIARRHDWPVASGFGWGGTQDDQFQVGHPFSADRAGYRREQILSSSLFRVYLALGGSHGDLAVRRRASRYMLHTIFSAIAGLSPQVPPQDAGAFAEELMQADLATTAFEGHPGGALHKAIRWAFEQQGFYQPLGAPTPVVAPGAPPPVDVFVDDGRGGGYQPTSDFGTVAPDLWCRRQADGGLTHEDPVAGAGTFVYVRVRNRGTLAADGLVARVFICGSSTDRTWPDRWQPLVPHQVTAAASLAAAGAVILGPFEWAPEQDGAHLLLADADCPDDPSNAQSTLQGKIDGVLLAHLDNNAAVRTVQVAAALPS